MYCQTAFTHIQDERSAIQKLASELNGNKLAYLLCYYTADYDFQEIAQCLSEFFPHTPFHGTSSCRAIMTDQGHHQGPVIAAMAVYESGSHAYGTGLAKYQISTKKSVNEALDMALHHADRVGEVPNLILLHATPGREEAIIKCIDDRFGTLVPIIGGSSADNDIKGNWSIITTQGSEQSGLSITLFYSSQSVDVSFSAGHTPTIHSGVVTDACGRCVLEIDGEPALDVYRFWTETQEDSGDDTFFLFDKSTAYPLGRLAGLVSHRPYYKLSHPVRGTPEGGIELFTDINMGDIVTLMKGNKECLLSRVTRVVNTAFNQKFENSQKIGVINIFCAGSMLNLKQDITNVYEQVTRELNNKPFICPFTFGEQGRFIGGENGHANLMISSAIFHKPNDE
ncbi:histidine kinase [Vibrio azureus]|uniref:Histidine kinase n=1 Tax=Vibrio azureus NBRC 104587 TaxID=1219077 RepID=U3AMT2_9VIBR|nr:FIST N-terminal domain-containing protein [Vibrio azureus]AUI86130.1 histidine kinase [Vibrio azureus]GAD74607.1 hypothetical protein VAZ01S_013_00140 [Vibrio azureus NBRC 104587]